MQPIISLYVVCICKCAVVRKRVHDINIYILSYCSILWRLPARNLANPPVVLQSILRLYRASFVWALIFVSNTRVSRAHVNLYSFFLRYTRRRFIRVCVCICPRSRPRSRYSCRIGTFVIRFFHRFLRRLHTHTRPRVSFEQPMQIILLRNCYS